MMMEEFEREQVLAALSFKPKDDRVGDFEKSFICDEEYSEKIFWCWWPGGDLEKS